MTVVDHRYHRYGSRFENEKENKQNQKNIKNQKDIKDQVDLINWKIKSLEELKEHSVVCSFFQIKILYLSIDPTNMQNSLFFLQRETRNFCNISWVYLPFTWFSCIKLGHSNLIFRIARTCEKPQCATRLSLNYFSTRAAKYTMRAPFFEKKTIWAPKTSIMYHLGEGTRPCPFPVRSLLRVTEPKGD